jgi:hypothetical protein
LKIKKISKWKKSEFSLDLAVAKQAFVNEMKSDYTKQFDGTAV